MLPYLQWRSGAEVSNVAGFSTTLTGFAYWQGGVVGAVLFMMALGLALSIFTRAERRAKKPLALAALALGYSSWIYALETPQDAMNAAVFRLLTLVVLHVATASLAVPASLTFPRARYAT